jgi:hypothetical protein
MTSHERDWIETKFAQLTQKVEDVRVDIATLKARAGVWGLIGGLIPAVGLAIYFLLDKRQ